MELDDLLGTREPLSSANTTTLKRHVVDMQKFARASWTRRALRILGGVCTQAPQATVSSSFDEDSIAAGGNLLVMRPLQRTSASPFRLVAVEGQADALP
jgi:hypothetical protein